MKNVVIRSGVIIGVILSVYLLIATMSMSSETDMSTAENIGNAVMFLVIGGILFFTLKKYRDEENAGSISFGQVFVKGILATLVAATIYSLTWTIYSNVADTNYTEMLYEMTINEMQEEGASDEEIELVLEQFEMIMPYYEMPPIMFLITIIEPLFPGILASLILGFILRKKGSQDENNSGDQQ